MEKGNIEWADPLAKGQHLLFELLKVDLFDDVVQFTLLSDESHEYCFLKRTHNNQQMRHLTCAQLNENARSDMFKLTR